MKTGLFGGIRKANGGPFTKGMNSADGSEGTSRDTGAEKEKAVPAPAAAPSHVVSPVVARMFRRAAASGTKSATLPRQSDEAPAVAAEQPGMVPQIRAFASSIKETVTSPASPSDRQDDEFFRKRLAIQRASNIWSPLIVAWFDASEASRGAWSLAGLMTDIRAEARSMAEAGLATRSGDEKMTLSLMGMLAKAVACELRTASRNGGSLGRDAIKEAGAALQGILEEPPAATLREPPSDGVHVRGRTSLAISTADIAARLLPLIGRHAGLASREVLETVLGEIRRRSEALVAGILPDTATERDRQSLLQSMMRREAELMASCLEHLPAAGTASFGGGRVPLDRELERYRELSAALAREVERVAGHVHASVNMDERLPAPG